MPPIEQAPYTIITFVANGESFGPSVSDGERYVVFTSEASDLTADHDNGRAAFRTFTTPNGAVQVNGTVVSNPDEATTDPALTDDGSAVVYSASSGFTVRTRVGGATAAEAAGNGPLRTPAVAATTGLVAATSYATDLIPAGDPNGTIGDIVTAP